jgi:hypothetical protein
MAAKHSVSLIMMTADKALAVTGTIGSRESINLILTDAEENGHDPADLRLYLLNPCVGTELAKCETFTETDGSGNASPGSGIFEGVLDTNTAEMSAFFSGTCDQTVKAVTCLVRDETNEQTLANDAVDVQNMPLEDDAEDPTPIDPIGA